jgi:hypothetical protein
MSKTHRDSLTKDLDPNLVFEDKGPFSVFEQPGFRNCIQKPNPAYIPPSRHTVAEVADQIADECLKDVTSILSKHVADGGTVCLAADAWTKKRRKFIATVAYFIVKWRLMRAVISCKAVLMGQSVTAAKIVVNVEDGLERMGLSFENVFAATKDEGADIAAAFRSTDAADVPCNAHIQQSNIQDIYIKYPAASLAAARLAARLAAGEQACGWSKWRIRVTVMKQSFHAGPSLVFCELVL